MSDEAIPAATLILVRERTEGPPELLMVERAAGMAFAAGAWVFPGGRIDEQDQGLAERFDESDASARIAAIRETLEETAIPVALDPQPSRAEALAIQAKLIADTPVADVLSDFTLRLSDLTPLARWVPRFHAKRRFDTLFFVARAPGGELQPNVIEGECTGAHWITAAEVLERDRAGELQLIFPTRRTLERLAQHASLDAIIADARAHPVEQISPWIETEGDGRYLRIPDNLGFPVTREKLDDLWRG